MKLEESKRLVAKSEKAAVEFKLARGDGSAFSASPREDNDIRIEGLAQSFP